MQKRYTLSTFVVGFTLLVFFLCAGAAAPTKDAPRVVSAQAGDILYQDDFSSTLSGWDTINDTNWSSGYSKGSYQITLGANYKDSFFSAWDKMNQDLTDVSIEADVSQIAGPSDSRFGVVCRVAKAAANDEVSNYYAFTIGENGHWYSISRYSGVEGKHTLLATYRPETNTPFSVGIMPHRLRADCIGDRLALYVDGRLVAEAQDPAPLSNGVAGFYVEAGPSEKGGAGISFDNFLARTGSPELLSTASVAAPLNHPYPIVADDFVDNRNKWVEHDDAQILKAIQNGVYHWHVNNAEATAPLRRELLNVNMSDVSLEIDIAKNAGDDLNTFHLRCRHQEGIGNYRFEIGTDGYFGISKQKGDDFIELARHDASKELVNPGNAQNHIRADCVGDILTLYVNGKQVEQVRDQEYTTGDVGFGVSGASGLDVEFDNFVVKSPVVVTADDIKALPPVNTTVAQPTLTPKPTTRPPTQAPTLAPTRAPTKAPSACNLQPGETGLLISNGYKETMRFTIGGQAWGTHDYDIVADGKLYLIHMPPGTYTYSASIPGAGKAKGEKYDYTLGTCRTIRFTP